MNIWAQVAAAIAEIAVHVDRNLCIRPKPDTIPLKLCIRPAIDGSFCCSRHRLDCPVK